MFSPIDLYGQYVTHLALLASSINGGVCVWGGGPFPFLPLPYLDQCVLVGEEAPQNMSVICIYYKGGYKQGQ